MRQKMSKEEKLHRREVKRRMAKRYPKHLAVRMAVGTFFVLVLVLGLNGLVNMLFFLVSGYDENLNVANSIADSISYVLEIQMNADAGKADEQESVERAEESIAAIGVAFEEQLSEIGIFFGNDSDGYRYTMEVDPSDPEVAMSSPQEEVNSDALKAIMKDYREFQKDKPDSSYEVTTQKAETLGLSSYEDLRSGVFLREYPVEGTDDSFIVLMKIDIGRLINGQKWYYQVIFLMLLVVFVVVMLFTIWRMHRKVIRPLRKIGNASFQFVGKTERFKNPEQWIYEDPKIRSKDEIQALSDMMIYMTDHMKSAVNDLLAANSEKERIGTELSLATRIQNSMLPGVFPPFPDRHEFSIYALMDPAKEVGGDFYDFFFVDETHLALVIADVSGKGVPAALFMMSTMLLIQNLAKEGHPPAELLQLANERIAASNTANMFVTVWFGILDTATGVIRAANAGHEYPAIRKAGESFSLLKDKHGFVIGEMDGMRYKEYDIVLQPGDTLFVYTDGVPEAQNLEEKFFGTAGMLDALNVDPGAEPEALIRKLRAAMTIFVGKADQFDDATMLCLKYNGTDNRYAEEQEIDNENT
ncbi:MAG: serine/threonine-protein phosphatase [Blautia sp.]|nr:serine/threonine-protein phosphatase [Blautia sp.]